MTCAPLHDGCVHDTPERTDRIRAVLRSGYREEALCGQCGGKIHRYGDERWVHDSGRWVRHDARPMDID